MMYLQHPAHGIKVAYTPDEIADDKKNGWQETQIGPMEPTQAIAKSDEAPEKSCPQCGKSFQRGLTMHMKFCKGP